MKGKRTGRKQRGGKENEHVREMEIIMKTGKEGRRGKREGRK